MDRGAPEPSDGLAPVIPLFGRGGARRDDVPSTEGHVEATPAAQDAVWRSTWVDDTAAAPDARLDAEPAEVTADPVEPTDGAEKTLLKRLRGRSLSVSESRALLVREGAADAADAIVARFAAMGYLDDAALAEQIVHVGLDRKGQGRRVIAQTLAQRGIPRDVAEAALQALPDDDRERALEYARTKARSLAKVEPEAALRRLAGQLARRGYGGSIALDVAREALREAGGERGFVSGAKRPGGVRFVEG